MYLQTSPTWQWHPEWARRAWPIDNIPAAPVIPEKKIPPGLAVARATNQIDGNDVAGKVTPETVTNGPATIKMAEMAGTLTLQKLSTSALKQSKSAQDVCRSTCLLYFPRLKRRCWPTFTQIRCLMAAKGLLLAQCCIIFVKFARKNCVCFWSILPDFAQFCIKRPKTPPNTHKITANNKITNKAPSQNNTKTTTPK